MTAFYFSILALIILVFVLKTIEDKEKLKKELKAKSEFLESQPRYSVSLSTNKTVYIKADSFDYLESELAKWVMYPDYNIHIDLVKDDKKKHISFREINIKTLRLINHHAIDFFFGKDIEIL